MMKEREDFMVPRNQIIACVIRQYGTGLYRTCVSLEKNKTICLSTHQDEASASEIINRFLETYQTGKINTLGDFLDFMSSIPSEDPAVSLEIAA
jgi:hypothetical protein